MRKHFLSLCLIISVLQVYTQPKLVVGIVVDQMRYDYIHRYWNKFGNGGFKRLINEGFSCNNTSYTYVPTFTAPGHASIYTGSTPSVHGIVANTWFDVETGWEVDCVSDKSVTGIEGVSRSGRVSPKNLMASTIGDELRKANGNTSKVIGIALKDRSAILPAGRNANAAFWFDVYSGKWITSSYYMQELPLWVKMFNQENIAAKYLSQPWDTYLPIEQYTESDVDDNNCEEPFMGMSRAVFPYDLPRLINMNGGLRLIRTVPFGNSFTIDFAIATIQGENLGKRTVPDFLSISFSSTDYIGHQFGPQSVEVEDCYIRLDKDIERLIQYLDEWIGRDEILLFLTSDHGASESVSCLQKKNLNAGVVYEFVLEDSINKFLFKKYADHFLLGRVLEPNIYLNRKRIREKGIEINEVQQAIASYLKTQKGILSVFSTAEILTSDLQDSIADKVKAGYYPKRSGNLEFVLKPNWYVGYPRGTTHGSPYWYDSHVPLIWWGGQIPKGDSSTPLRITQIAPTVYNLLNIQIPPGSIMMPIVFPKN